MYPPLLDRVPPDCISTSDTTCPFTSSTPPFTTFFPVYVFFPLSINFPVPAFISPASPDISFSNVEVVLSNATFT